MGNNGRLMVDTDSLVSFVESCIDVVLSDEVLNDSDDFFSMTDRTYLPKDCRNKYSGFMKFLTLKTFGKYTEVLSEEGLERVLCRIRVKQTMQSYLDKARSLEEKGLDVVAGSYSDYFSDL